MLSHLKRAVLKSAIIKSFKLKPKQTSIAYKTGHKLIQTNVYIVQNLSEAYCLNIKNNIDSNKFFIPSGIPQDKIYLSYGGDAGKGLFVASISSLTREHPNSEANSVPVICFEKPAIMHHNKSSHYIQLHSIMPRPMMNVVTISDGKSLKSYVCLLCLDYWGQRELNKDLPVCIRSHPNLLTSKKDFFLQTAQAHNSKSKLLIISVENIIDFDDDTDFDLFCRTRPIQDESDRHISINSKCISAEFDGIIGVERQNFIICILRISGCQCADTNIYRFAVYGRGLFHPKIPINNTNIDRDIDRYFIFFQQPTTLSKQQQYIQSIYSSPNELSIAWTAFKVNFFVVGDFDYICKITGHRGSSTKYPSPICLIDKSDIRSKRNCERSVQKECVHRTQRSMADDLMEWSRSTELPLSHGVAEPSLVPSFFWCVGLPTFHITEGIMAKQQAALLHGMQKILKVTEASTDKVNKLWEWQEEKMKLLQWIEEGKQFVCILENSSIEKKDYAPLQHEHVKERLGEIDLQIEKLVESLDSNNKFKQIYKFMDDHGMIQKDYRPGSLKGSVVRKNLAHFDILCDQIESSIDQELGKNYRALMSHFSFIYDMISKHGDKAHNTQRKNEKKQKVYGQKLTLEQQQTLRSSIEEYIPMFYSFLWNYGEKAAKVNEINSGIKIHNFEHIMDYIQLFDGMRPSYFNEERIEKMVQFVAKTLYPYHHFFGAKRLRCALRACNMKSLFHALFLSDFVIGDDVEEFLNGEDEVEAEYDDVDDFLCEDE